VRAALDGLRGGGAQLKALENLDKRVARLQHSLDKGMAVPRPSKEERPLVELEYSRADIRLVAASKAARKRRHAATKERWTVAWIEQSLGSGDVLWDIGANVGAYALIAAKVAPPDVRVIAVEPAAATFAVLCENVVLNDVAARVTPLPITLGAHTGLGVLRYSQLAPGAAFHASGDAPPTGRGDDDDARSDGGRTFRSAYDQPVLAYRLDDLVATFGLPAPTHVKLDVDGAELDVLRGAERTLERVRSLMVEVADEQRAGIDDLLEAAGLRAAERHGRPGAGFDYVRFERG
jgi:FkbM family methyltransferase